MMGHDLSFSGKGKLKVGHLLFEVNLHLKSERFLVFSGS